MLRTRNAVVLALAIGGAALTSSLSGCTPEVPAHPTWEADVHPILQARCERCHSTQVITAQGSAQRSDLIASKEIGAPTTSFDYATTADLPTNVMVGITTITQFWKGALTGKDNFLRLPDENSNRMPPIPATRLEDWQIDTIERWANALQ